MKKITYLIMLTLSFNAHCENEPLIENVLQLDQHCKTHHIEIKTFDNIKYFNITCQKFDNSHIIFNYVKTQTVLTHYIENK